MAFQLQITIILLMFWLGILGKLSYAETKVGYYDGKCGSANVEKIVFDTVQKHMGLDNTIPPRIVRLFFHDCFVQGCDASVLLAGANTEQTSVPNLSLVKAFPVIDDAKAQLEAVCPSVVSCADIIALAARDSVLLTQSPFMSFFGRFGVPISFQVKTGRLDGKISLARNTANLPAPTDNVTVQTQKFSEKGLSVKDLVTLVGAHTIGASRCQFFINRLYNFNGTGGADPSINKIFLQSLRTQCPQTGGDNNTRVPLDSTPNTFDNKYFMNLKDQKGVLASDQVLLNDNTTGPIVQGYYLPGFIGRFISKLNFTFEFGQSMKNMGEIELKLPGNVAGEIRTVCNATNT